MKYFLLKQFLNNEESKKVYWGIKCQISNGKECANIFLLQISTCMNALNLDLVLILIWIKYLKCIDHLIDHYWILKYTEICVI